MRTESQILCWAVCRQFADEKMGCNSGCNVLCRCLQEQSSSVPELGQAIPGKPCLLGQRAVFMALEQMPVLTMQEASGRGMWQPDDDKLHRLQQLYSDLDEQLEGLNTN